MNFLLIYAHPSHASFNHALLDVTQSTLTAAGHSVRVHDLYARGFNPVMSGEDFAAMQSGIAPADVAALQEDIAWADRLFFTYPIWWYSTPAILLGYIDRVFTSGFAYKFGEAGAQGLLKHDRALVFQTAGNPESVFGEDGKAAIHVPMKKGTLEYCGIKDVRMHTFFGVPRAGESEREHMLAEVKELVEAFAA